MQGRGYGRGGGGQFPQQMQQQQYQQQMGGAGQFQQQPPRQQPAGHGPMTNNSTNHVSSSQRVSVNPLDANLDFVLSQDLLTGSTVSTGGFGYMHSGARANLGLLGGKHYFRVVVGQLQSVTVGDWNGGDLTTNAVARIGLSTEDSDVGHLGEVPNSFGYNISGKTVCDGMYSGYGPAYAPNDEIICFLDLSRVPGAISFSLNGKPLGEAFTVPSGKPLFPHVLLKNVSVTMDFEGRGMLNGYQPWSVSLRLDWGQQEVWRRSGRAWHDGKQVHATNITSSMLQAQ